MATTRLRLTGVTKLQLVSAGLSLLPLAYVGYQVWGRGLGLSSRTLPLVAVAAVVALLPWVSRLYARANYRASFDDLAVHFRGQALVYKTITEAVIEKTARTTLLILRRDDIAEMTLVLDDAFAGRLEPWEPLRQKLKDHGHDV